MSENEKKQRNLATAAVVTGAALGASTASHAEAIIDATPVVTDLNDTKPQMIDTGTAMIGLVLVAVIFMMFRRVLR